MCSSSLITMLRMEPASSFSASLRVLHLDGYSVCTFQNATLHTVSCSQSPQYLTLHFLKISRLNFSVIFTNTNLSWSLKTAHSFIHLKKVHSSCVTSLKTWQVWPPTGSLNSAGVTSLPFFHWWVRIYSWLVCFWHLKCCRLELELLNVFFPDLFYMFFGVVPASDL